jgi:hypothetical protein
MEKTTLRSAPSPHQLAPLEKVPKVDGKIANMQGSHYLIFMYNKKMLISHYA